MRDTVSISRVTGQAWDDNTGTYTPASTVLYAGQADVRPLNQSAQEVQVAERELVLRTYDVVLPWSVTATFERGDLVEVTACDDETLTGRVLTVRAVGHGGRRTGHHLDAEDKSA
jgi:hypothetical protein